MPILVMKFGGTSVGSAEAIQRSTNLAITECSQHQVVVVVSALSGITNLLVEGAAKAAEDRHQATITTKKFLDRHITLIYQINLGDESRKALLRKINSNGILLYNSLFHMYRSAHSYEDQIDDVLSLGELSSASIFTSILRSKNILTKEVDARQLICTDEAFTQAHVNQDETDRQIKHHILTALETNQMIVIPGFVGRTKDGRTTTLGRGASDYSASVVAAALDADEVWNWTDVNGVYTVDPRLHDSATVIPDLSYHEMASLAKYGAKILHPDSVAPLIRRNIPLRIKNSFLPQQPGTLIHAAQPERGPAVVAMSVRPVATNSGILTEIILLNGYRSQKRILTCLQSNGISVISSNENTLDGSVILHVQSTDQSRAIQVLHRILFPVPQVNKPLSQPNPIYNQG